MRIPTAAFLLIVVSLAGACREGQAREASVQKTFFGTMPKGGAVDQYTMENAAGLKVRLITYGAMIVAVETPDRNGHFANITLHRDSLAEYLAGHPMFGCVVGRYANRIGNARFTLDGANYSLSPNNGRHHIHGGSMGFDKYVWQARAEQGRGVVSVRLEHVSRDGDEGYPGKLSVTLTYSLNDSNELTLDYKATTDKPTHVNLTNHAYWNLAGAGPTDVLGHVLVLNADRVLPVDADLIPTGLPVKVAGSALDFTQPQTIGRRIAETKGGYDHCYVVNGDTAGKLAFAARVVEPKSGRTLEVRTTQPGVQLYTANHMAMKDSSGALRYGKHGALCLETQHYPDSPNRSGFPSTVLRPGQTYHEVTVYKFGVEPAAD